MEDRLTAYIASLGKHSARVFDIVEHNYPPAVEIFATTGIGFHWPSLFFI